MEGLTADWVERALLEEESKIARSKGNQLRLILMADQMQLPTADGCRSLVEWVAGRLDVSRETASSLVGAARRLDPASPLMDELVRGDITFDRVEATSRMPDESDRDLRHLDIAGVRRLAANRRRMTRVDDHEAHQTQHLATQPNLDESMWDIWGRLDGYSGSVVNKVLTEEADLLPELPEGGLAGVGYRKALALTKVCEDRSGSSTSGPLVTVFVDSDGASIETGPAVGPEILDRIACTGSLEIIKTQGGQPLSVGRKTRVISKKLRRFVMHRDGGCTAEGCTSRYRLQAHHVIPWSEGGPTDAENLVTLCWFHHHVVIHGWGYRIDASRGSSRIRFTRPERAPPG